MKVLALCDVCSRPRSDSTVGTLLGFFGKRRCHCLFNESSLPRLVTADDGDVDTDSAEYKHLLKHLGDKYEVLGLIGRGGMGAVYKVKSKSLGRVFAVKILKSELINDRIAMKRFEQEARAASQLTHPNLVAVYDFGTAREGSAFLVMDYLSGSSLADAIEKEGYLEAKRAVDIFIQIAEAISHAHKKGVIHRDIKPSNIMLMEEPDKPPFVKLVDFGIAKVAAENAKVTQNLTATGEIFGSPQYMSPEQCIGADIDARADIYSIGCVMYEVLAGRCPFVGDNPIQTVLKHINEAPQPISNVAKAGDVSEDLELVIMQCLAKAKEDRYQDANDLVRDLQAIARKEKPRFAKPLRLQTKAASKSTTRRSGRLIAFGATCAVLMVAAGVATMVFNGWVASMKTAPPNEMTEAESLDSRAYAYFTQGKYRQAIPLLEFGVQTYRQKHGSKEDTYLADNLQHIAWCHAKIAEQSKDADEKKSEFDKAEELYKDAMRIYWKYGLYTGSGIYQAADHYAELLRSTGRADEAAQVLKSVNKG